MESIFFQSLSKLQIRDDLKPQIKEKAPYIKNNKTYLRFEINNNKKYTFLTSTLTSCYNVHEEELKIPEERINNKLENTHIPTPNQ